MRVTVQLPDALAQSVRGGERTTDALALERLVRELDIELQPLHAATDDPALRRYFTAEVADDARGHRAAERLRASPLIAAAYVKPPEAMP